MDPSHIQDKLDYMSNLDQLPRADVPADRLEVLSIEKLTLEIRALKNPWRYSAPHIAAAATITAALLTVTWAALSGFFDIARRELEVRKSELEIETRAIREVRDQQSAKFQREKAAYASEIAGLRQRLDQYDRPIAIYTSVEGTPWRPGRGPASIVVYLSGVNLGKTKPKAALLDLWFGCSSALHLGNLDPRAGIRGVIDSWSDEHVRVRFPASVVKDDVRKFLKTRLDPHRESTCRAYGSVSVERSDGKLSNAVAAELDGVEMWAVR